MREDAIKLCMIGAGNHASTNIHPYFGLLRGAHVSALADLDKERARSVAQRFGIAATYTDYHEMLAIEKPDGVLMCVNAAFHARVAVEIMQMGYHVYTEKPSAPALADAVMMLQASRSTKKICMTAYKKRFAPAYVKARDIILSDDFGRPALITLLRTKDHGPNQDNSPYLLEWGCHVLDLMPFLFGDVTSVQAVKTAGTTHAYSITMAFANGALGNLAVTDRPGGLIEEINAFGGNRVTVRTRNSICMEAFRGDQPFAAHVPAFTQGNPGAVEAGFLGELQEFVDAISEGREPQSNAESALHTMAIYDAIQKSVTNGYTVTVQSVEDLL